MLRVMSISAKTKLSMYGDSKYAALAPSGGPDSANENCIMPVQIQKVLSRLNYSSMVVSWSILVCRYYYSQLGIITICHHYYKYYHPGVFGQLLY